MNETIIIQIILSIAGTVGSLFALIRYIAKINQSRESSLLTANQVREKQMLEYFEKKNGHIERIAKEFSDTTRMANKNISDLTTEIRVMNETNRQLAMAVNSINK